MLVAVSAAMIHAVRRRRRWLSSFSCVTAVVLSVVNVCGINCRMDITATTLFRSLLVTVTHHSMKVSGVTVAGLLHRTQCILYCNLSFSLSVSLLASPDVFVNNLIHCSVLLYSRQYLSKLCVSMGVYIFGPSWIIVMNGNLFFCCVLTDPMIHCDIKYC